MNKQDQDFISAFNNLFINYTSSYHSENNLNSCLKVVDDKNSYQPLDKKIHAMEMLNNFLNASSFFTNTLEGECIDLTKTISNHKEINNIPKITLTNILSSYFLLNKSFLDFYLSLASLNSSGDSINENIKKISETDSQLNILTFNKILTGE